MQEAFDSDLKAKRLRNMKRMATGLLFLMAVIFVVSHYYREALPWLNYVRAFAEAAMVGAMADWFAVTALFKHPMGIPIPHTAIIPKRKDEIGQTLANFVSENFLTPAVLEPKLIRMHISQRIGEWLSKEENAKRLTEDTKSFLHWLFSASDTQNLKQFTREHLQVGLREVQITPLIAKILELLTINNRHQSFVDLLLRAIWKQLQVNKHKLRDKIDKESPWWLPSFVDEEIYNKISLQLEQAVLQIGSDENHEARKNFNQALLSLIEKFKTDEDMIAKGEQIKNELLEHPSVQAYLGEIWSSISNYFLREVEDKDSNLRDRLQNTVQSFGQAMLDNVELKEQVDTWVMKAGMYVVTHYSDDMGQVISDTVKSWDAELTSQRIELQVGRDLQFIRINGTLVGGIVGLIIYVVSTHLLK